MILNHLSIFNCPVTYVRINENHIKAVKQELGETEIVQTQIRNKIMAQMNYLKLFAGNRFQGENVIFIDN